MTVSVTQGLQLSCAGLGLMPLATHGSQSPTQLLVKVTISGVITIEPDESTITEMRFLTGWARARPDPSATSTHPTVRTIGMQRGGRRM